MSRAVHATVSSVGSDPVQRTLILLSILSFTTLSHRGTLSSTPSASGMLARSRIACRPCPFVRTLATTARVLPSSAYSSSSAVQGPATSSTPQDVTEGERNALDAALRVDQAGEIAANYIYMGQHFVLGRDRKVGPLIEVSCPASALRLHVVAYCETHGRICGNKRRNIWT